MFKRSFFFAFYTAFWLLPGSISAQTPLMPADVKPDYSQEAFVVELNYTRIAFENDGAATRESTARVRIQSGAGVQRFGVLTFPYENSTGTVEIDYVRVRKPDGTVVSTPPDNVQDMASEITRQAPSYSDLREKHVAVKGLGVGDVLESQIHWRVTKPLVPGQFWLSYNFTHEGIVLQEQLQISMPRDRAVKWKSANSKPAITEEGERRIFTWTGSNLKEQERAEQQRNTYQAARGKYPPPEIQISTYQTWEEVGKWYTSLQQHRAKSTPEIRAKAEELTKKASTEDEKVEAIYRYVSGQFHYISISFGVGRYQAHSANEVLANQYGDCKDKHTLLASLLEAVGIKAYPALINSSHDLDQDVPSPGQFDHVISVIARGDRLTWVDTTPEVARYAYLIGFLRDKQALVIPTDRPAALMTTPAAPPSKASQTFRIQAKLDDTGTLQGKVERTVQGNDNELLLRSAFRNVPMPQWKNLIQQISLASGFAGETTDVSAESPEKVDEPFRFNYAYTRKDYPDWSNRRISPPVPPIVLPQLEDDAKKPSSPIWLGASTETRLESRLELPKGYTPELPGNIDLSEDFAEYHASNEFKDGVLTTERRFIVKLQEVTPEKYETYKKFSKAVSNDHEQFIALMSGVSTTASIMASYQTLVQSLPYSDSPEASRAYDEARSGFQRLDIKGGIASLERAVEVDPKFVRAWLMLGELYTFSLQIDQSLEAYRKAVAINPRLNIVYKMRGYMLLGTQQFEEAVPIWEEYIKIVPNDSDGPANLATAFEGLERYEESVSALESAIKLNPHPADLYARLGSAYLKAGNDDKALAAYRRALELDPNPVDYNNIGYALADARKKMDVALEYAQKAVRMEEDASSSVKFSYLQVEDLWHSTNLASYWDTLGWVYFQMANFDQAEKYLHSSWTLAQSGVVADHLGQVYEQQHKKAEAIKTYKLAAYCFSLEKEGRTEEIENIEERLNQLDPGRSEARPNPYVQSSEDLYQLRNIKLPQTAGADAKAEFFVVLAPDPKTLAARVEDVKFIKGAEGLKSADKWLRTANFNFMFPDQGQTRLLRRGTLGCHQHSGCTFTLMQPDEVSSVN